MEIQESSSNGDQGSGEAAQLSLTPEAANPPPPGPQQPESYLKKRYAIPDKILPPEDKPLIPREEARNERRKNYIRNGS